MAEIFAIIVTAVTTILKFAETCMKNIEREATACCRTREKPQEVDYQPRCCRLRVREHFKTKWKKPL